MKNDPFFKYIAAISIVGVFIALLSPSRPVIKAESSVVAIVQEAEPTE